MKRNTIKIVCNPFQNKISYFYKNEIGEWLLLSGSSPLSRQSYTKANIKDSCKSIVEKLNEVYNRKNKGLDIVFEGTSENYEYLSDAVNTCFRNCNIKCRMNPTRIAIVGKKGVGKTVLIEGIAKAYGYKLIKTDNTQYVKYGDKYHHIEWLEVKGIDIGSEYVEETYNVLSDLVHDGLSKVIYCVSGATGKIEKMEKSLLIELKKSFPSIDIITAITMCYKEDTQHVIDEIEKYVGNENIFPVLAQEYRPSIKNGGMVTSSVNPFGLDELITFVFEGKRLSYKFSKKKSGSAKIETQPQSLEDEAIKKSVVYGSNQGKAVQVSKETDAKTPVIDEKKNTPIESEHIVKMQRIAVAGKITSGKTTLIKGFEEYTHGSLTSKIYEGYQVYKDGFLEWCEVRGIDLGREGTEEAFAAVVKLADNSMTHMIYCISGETGRVEKTEKDFITKIKQTLPNVEVLVVLTKCYKDDPLKILNYELERIVGKGNVVQTLALAYKTGIKNPKTGEPLLVDTYGLDILYDKIRGKSLK